MKELKETIKNRDVYIIGGGNTLKSFNFDKLKNKNIIAVNSTYKSVKNYNPIVVWYDHWWINKNSDELIQSQIKHTYHINSFCKNLVDTTHRGIANSQYLYLSGNSGYDQNLYHVRGNNTGTMALHLAINLHPKTIHLLGFDMRPFNGKTHYHDEYTTELNYYQKYIQCMNILHKETEHLGINIINYSNISALECFIKRDIREIK